MAKVHFVKDGLTKQGTSSTTAVDITLEQVESIFSGYNFKFTASPPRINPETQVNDFAAYKYVVLEVEPDEYTDSFQNVGYYFLTEMTFAECKKILNNSDIPKI